MNFVELTRKDGQRFLYDFDSHWEIDDKGPDEPAWWSNHDQGRNFDAAQTYEVIRAQVLRPGAVPGSSAPHPHPVRWEYRDTRDGEWCRHYRGDYVVECQDMDGDATEWNVWLRKDYDRIPGILKRNQHIDDLCRHEHIPDSVANGRVIVGHDFAIAKVIAIAALEAMLKEDEREEAEFRAHPERFPGRRAKP